MRFSNPLALSLLTLCSIFNPVVPAPSAPKGTDPEEWNQIITLNSLLRNVGINATRLAIVGSQSSGKSSVIEGILGISMPKGDGTQTRVPIEVVARRGDFFHATVGVKDPSDPGTWLRIPESVSSKEDMEQKIREAQKVALGNNQNGFSNTPVVVDVTDKDLHDLTFVDLPGLVQSSSQGNAKDKYEQVSGVVRSAAQIPGTILVHVISAENNINNGAGKEIIEEIEKVDTIGVVTKPDKLGESDGDATGVMKEYERLLRNQIEGLKYDRKWYAVKSPDPTVVKTPEEIKKARDQEVEWFLKDSRWAQIIKNSNSDQRVGFDHLREAMAKILVDDFNNKKFEYDEELSNLLNKYREELAQSKESHRIQKDMDGQLISAVRGAMRQEKDFDLEVASMKPLHDAAFKKLRKRVMNDIPGFKLLKYALNKADDDDDAKPAATGKDDKTSKKQKNALTDAEQKCVDKYDYYKEQKNKIYDMIESSKLFQWGDNLLSVPAHKRLQMITKNWSQYAREFNMEIYELVRKTAMDAVSAKAGSDSTSIKVYESAVRRTLESIKESLDAKTNPMIEALIGPYTTDTEMIYVLKEAYAVFFGRVLESNSEQVKRVLTNLQKQKTSVLRVAGVGAGGVALVAVTATLISTITTALPFVAIGAPLLFLIPGGSSLLMMGGTIIVGGVKLLLSPIASLSKSKNREKVKKGARMVSGDIGKIVSAFSDKSKVPLKFDDNVRGEEVFSVWVEETAIADMISHRLFRNMYMMSSYEIIQKFSEKLSNSLMQGASNPANNRFKSITALEKKTKTLQTKIDDIKRVQNALRDVIG
jgi:hypothetical protein